MFGDTLAQLGDTHHRIERLDLPARRAIDDIAQVNEIFLEHIERAEPVERRSEEHTSELQSLMRISYAVFCLKKKKQNIINIRRYYQNTKNLISSTIVT